MNKQFLIVIDGLNGAGKTTVSHLLHGKLKRTALLSFDITKRLISDFKPNDEYHGVTNRILRGMVKEYLTSGFNVILESFFPDKKFLLPYLEISKKKKVHTVLFQIEAPFKVRYKRIQERPLAPGAKKKMTKQWIKRNDDNYFQNKYKKAEVIQSHDKTPEQIAKLILKFLGKK